MVQAKSGDKVAVHYTGKLEDGTVFDTSAGRPPLEFNLGTGQVVPGFEAAVMGMGAGETKSVTIPSDQAYGDAKPELTISIERDEIPADVEISVGQRLALKAPDGREVPVLVTELSDDTVTLDANHPLAGKTLVFEIELVEIKAA